MDDAAVDGDGVVEALVALDELLDGDRRDLLRAEVDQRRGRARPSSRPATVSWAPAPARGLRISGKPTASANAQTSSALSAAVDAAVGTPAWRSASFIDGLSRHSQVVRTEVPGMPVASRTWAAAILWASIGRLEPVDPDLVLRPPDGLVMRVDVGDR